MGGAIAAVCLIILILMFIDFIRYQRKRARVREISQRRNKNESHNRPTSFFVNKVSVPCYVPFTNPPSTSAQGDNRATLDPDSPNGSAILSNSNPVIVHGQGRVILPPLKVPPIKTVEGSQVDPSQSCLRKGRKKKLIPNRSRVPKYLPESAEVIKQDTDNPMKVKKRGMLPKKSRVDPLSNSDGEMDGIVYGPSDPGHHVGVAKTDFTKGQEILPESAPGSAEQSHSSEGLDLLWQHHLRGRDNFSFDPSGDTSRSQVPNLNSSVMSRYSGPVPLTNSAVESAADKDAALRHQMASPYYYSSQSNMADSLT